MSRGVDYARFSHVGSEEEEEEEEVPQATPPTVTADTSVQC